MPNLRSQSISLARIELVASDGRAFSLTAADVISHFAVETGSKPLRITKTIAWVKASIEAALGPEQVPASLIDFDFDDIQGMKNLGLGDQWPT